jgi:hypothetical protein
MPLVLEMHKKNPWKRLIIPGVKRGEHEGFIPSLII